MKQLEPNYYVIVEMINNNRYVYSFFELSTARKVAQENKMSVVVKSVVITKVMKIQ